MIICREGDQFKVKRNPRGVMVHGSGSDYIVTTGEIGTIKRQPYTAHDGTPMVSWSLEFTRGRRVSMTTPEAILEDNYSSGGSVACCFYPDEEERYARVKAKKEN